jgi:exopolysaccharide biosynthesis polyprenyl glycosylphosphotransferase
MASTSPAQGPEISGRVDLSPTELAEIRSHTEANGHGGPHFETIVTVCEIFADVITVVLTLLFAYGIYRWLAVGQRITYPLSSVTGMACLFALLVIGLLDRSGAYQTGNSLLRVRETERILRASIQASLFAFALSYFTKYMVSRGVLAIAFVAVPLLLVIEKQLIYGAIRLLHSRGYGVRKVIIYGAGMTGRRLFSALLRSPKLGLDPVAFVDDDPRLQNSRIFESSYRRRRYVRVLPGPLTSKLIRELKASTIVVGMSSVSRNKFLEIASEASAAGAAVSFVPYQLDPSMFWVDYADIDGLLVASIKPPSRQIHRQLIKKAFDFTASLLVLVVTAPLLLILAAIIRISSPGPAMFVQERVGLGGKVFRLYKFRTMHAAAGSYDYSPKNPRDPRITPIGRFLRRTSLDEIPQIFNVLKGEMSLVGPRPEMPFIVSQYQPLHRLRLTVTPGITGLWQLSADRARLIHENIEYDLYYIRNHCFFMDLAILLHTVIFAANGI